MLEIKNGNPPSKSIWLLKYEQLFGWFGELWTKQKMDHYPIDSRNSWCGQEWILRMTNTEHGRALSWLVNQWPDGKNPGALGGPLAGLGGLRVLSSRAPLRFWCNHRLESLHNDPGSIETLEPETFHWIQDGRDWSTRILGCVSRQATEVFVGGVWGGIRLLTATLSNKTSSIPETAEGGLG